MNNELLAAQEDALAVTEAVIAAVHALIDSHPNKPALIARLGHLATLASQPAQAHIQRLVRRISPTGD